MTDSRETPKQMEKRLELEVSTQEISDILRELLPEGTAFMLFLADVRDVDNSALSYASNTERESAIEILKVYLDDWGANQ